PSDPSLLCSADTPPPDIDTLSLHDALPIWPGGSHRNGALLRCARRTQSGPMPEANAPFRQPLTQPSLPASAASPRRAQRVAPGRSEEHTSELQSRENLVCRLLLEKKKQTTE